MEVPWSTPTLMPDQRMPPLSLTSTPHVSTPPSPARSRQYSTKHTLPSLPNSLNALELLMLFVPLDYATTSA